MTKRFNPDYYDGAYLCPDCNHMSRHVKWIGPLSWHSLRECLNCGNEWAINAYPFSDFDAPAVRPIHSRKL
jgi:transcription elongation factor Elf1